MLRVKRRSVFVTCWVGLAAASVAGAQIGAPSPISPGGADAFAASASTCPTFSWSGVEEARGYELVVYAASAEHDGAGHDAAASAEPILRAAIHGNGLSWTPSADGCLKLSGSYAWSVRAVGDGRESQWSPAHLFRVEPLVSARDLAAVVERALSRYLGSHGLELGEGADLATVISEELAGAAPAAAPAPPGPHYYQGGRRLVGEAPAPRGVFTDEIELWLEESGSGSSDKVQLVFATPEFDGDPSDAWAIVVEAEDSADPDDGKMFFSTPSFFDALQLFTDGSAIVGEQREMKLRPLSSPPIACTSFLQEGMFYWDDDISALCACDGSSWVPVDSDETGSCS